MTWRPWEQFNRRRGALAVALIFVFLSGLLSGISMENASANGPGSSGNSKRGKVIDFEDEVVEGVNRRPLDSLSQISERDRKRRKPHLYRKRASFRSENAETLRVLPFTP